MATLYLNLFPVHIKSGENAELVRRLEVADPGELRRLEGHGREFVAYSHRGFEYVWALPGGRLPEIAETGVPCSINDLPAAVVAYSARESLVATLRAKGFERIRGEFDGPARLFRWESNLATGSPGVSDGDRVGVFPVLRIQGVPLQGDRDAPGAVAIILDGATVQQLDVSLHRLAELGIPLKNLPVTWAHASGCQCEPRHRGRAGYVVAEQFAPTVPVFRSGRKNDVPSACLRATPTRHILAAYISTVAATTTRQQVLANLDSLATEYQRASEQWQKLEQTRVALKDLVLFDSVVAELGAAIAVAPEGSVMPCLATAAPSPQLNFQYGSTVTALSAGAGLTKSGPYDRDVRSFAAVHAVVLAPRELEADARRLARALQLGVGRFPGMKARYHLTDFDASVQTFADADLTGYRGGAVAATRSGADIVFLVTREAFRQAEPGLNPYLAAKAQLLNADIPVQAITSGKLRLTDQELRWILDSLCLQSYAKMGGIPYVLHDPTGIPEVVLGVGRHDMISGDGTVRQMFGAAVAFRRDGDLLFSGSTVPVAEEGSYQSLLTELIGVAIDRYEQAMGHAPKRVTVHVFKAVGHHEVQAARDAIAERAIEFALLHVNRDTPLWIAEKRATQVGTPAKGTVVALGEGDVLLVTSEERSRGSTRPLRLMLHRESTFADMQRIAAQAYGLTATSWRGFLQSNEPSTILFGRLLARQVAQLAPYGFDPARAASSLGNRPWFL